MIIIYLFISINETAVLELHHFKEKKNLFSSFYFRYNVRRSVMRRLHQADSRQDGAVADARFVAREVEAAKAHGRDHLTRRDDELGRPEVAEQKDPKPLLLLVRIPNNVESMLKR